MTSLKPLLIAMFCALLLVITEQVTRKRIFDNTAHFETRLLRAMVPDTEIVPGQKNTWIAIENSRITATIKAVETNEGYNGRIAFLMAYSDTGKILSIRTTQHRETPGLGDIIDHHASNWLDGFQGRSIDNTRWLLKPEGDIDGVTGATITARAMTRAIGLALSEIAHRKNEQNMEAPAQAESMRQTTP